MSTDTTVELEPLTVFPKERLGPVLRVARWFGHLWRRVQCWRRGTHLVGAYDDALWFEVADRCRSRKRPLRVGWSVAEEETVRVENPFRAPRDPVADYEPSPIIDPDIMYAAPEVVDEVRRRLQRAVDNDMYGDEVAALCDEYRSCGPAWAAELADYTYAHGRLPPEIP